ncbi:VacJ family lipoprotein [Sulfuritalea sp.]|uniref:MlaA family lipoprotein n=1 Tax=Sulfuritalea sp. TaxID=2480090 RepID=UPI001AD0E7DD|nr:VacJ family lipoprotein [Sulfuritalea sp.]MBN8473547.1 VacJ family lipoprotein [Sulfuritalea sp.]
MNKTLPTRLKSATLALLAAGLLAGCASSGNPKDPIEGFNRAMFAFNEGLDSLIVKPVATGYDAVLPSPIRTGVTNFFGNIDDLFIGVNNLLQGKIPEAFSDLGRVAINTTIGLLGVLDIATDAGLEKHNEDFGQTFGRWGVGNGAYVVIPVFGPRTVRDTVGLVLDVQADPVANHRPKGERDFAQVLRLVNGRANLLAADKVVEEAALDKYSYVRDAYLQRRRNLIHDGNPPRESEASLDTDRSLSVDARLEEPRAEAPSGGAVLVVRMEPVDTK